jgi:aryl-alcohol dehydrogenase-like predicted oxidoreductase
MQMRQLGTSDLKISPVIFGAWAIGGWMWGGQDQADSIEAIRAAIDHGVTTIDTAAIYGMGFSEQIVAKAIRGKRDKVQIATKCGMRWDSAAGRRARVRSVAAEGQRRPRRHHPQERPPREHRV